MGNVCHTNRKSKKYRTDSSNPDSSLEIDEVLNFKVEIGNIKARNLPIGSSYVKIQFGEKLEFQTPEIPDNVNNYSWKFHKEFDYSTTRRSLRDGCIVLNLMNKLDKEIGRITVNLNDIATGPSHHDFVLKIKKGRIDPGRISFDVKMSQIVSVSVRAQSINCKMVSSLREEYYNFSMKMSMKDREFFSEHSTNYKGLQMCSVVTEKNMEKNAEELLDENYQFEMDEKKKIKIKHYDTKRAKKGFRNDKHELETSETSKIEDESLIQTLKERRLAFSRAVSQRLSVHTPVHQWVPKKDLTWFYSEDCDFAPVLEMNVNVRELASGNFQFFLWANKKGLNKSLVEDDASDYSSEELYIDHKLVGECFIGTNKLFFRDSEMTLSNDDTGNRLVVGSATDTQPLSTRAYQKRIIKLTEKLLYHGDHEGELTAEFGIEYTPFFRQMLFGVRTEEGIQRSSSLYLDANSMCSFKNTNVKEIKVLRQHKDSLKNVTFNLYGPKVNPRTKIKLIDELATNIIKVHEILKTSHQESVISVLYKTPENLLASQKVLIGLTKHALDNCDEVPNSLRPIYFETLLMLIHRTEFELNYMGFDNSYKEFLKNAQKTSFKNDIGGSKVDLKNIQQKLKVCESYQSMLYLALQKVLTKLNQRGLPDKEREFVEQFTAIAYFRIPEFRKKLLECLKKEIEKIPVPEWRGIEWHLDDKNEDKENQHFISLFDWKNDFYEYLRNTEKGENNYKLLNEILAEKDWQNRLSKRGIAFHLFLNEWAKHVNKTVVTKDHVPWQDLPGYPILIKSFLIELKAKDVKRYPQPLLNASYSLLKNEKLLTIFVSIIYNKTRIYESANVFAVFELINHWFSIIKENKKTIPATFDYKYFFKGAIMIIEGDHALTTAKVLWVLYNNFNLFPYNEKEYLSEYLFGNIFFKLFLHWSWAVRQVFHHFLIYRFYHQHRIANTNLTNIDDLKKELLLYNQKRENYKKAKKGLINDFINMEYSRHMTLIENGYKKLRNDKNIRDPDRKSFSQPAKMPGRDRDRLRHNLLMDIPEFDPMPKQSPSLEDFESEKKEEYFPKLKLRGTSSEKKEVDVVDEFFEEPEKVARKQSVPQNGESSYWLINPDNLEVSMSMAGPGPVTNRLQRSESFNCSPPRKLDMGNRNDDMDMFGLEAAKLASEEPARMFSVGTKNSINLGPEDEKKSKEKRKVILRRLMYFDKQTNKLQEIPKEYIVYLEIAYKEYEQIKVQYVKWYNELQKTLASLPEEQAKKLKADPKVPELSVKIPLDDGEDGQIDMEEW